MGVGGQRQPRPLYPPRQRPGTHCIGGWVGPRAGLDGCEKSRPTGIWSPDRPARSESLYRLSYPSPQMVHVTPPHSHHWNFKHLSHRDTKPCFSASNLSESVVCSQKVSTCFASASVQNHLPGGCFLKGPKRWNFLRATSGLISPSCSGVTTQNSGSQYGPLKTYLAVGYLQQTPVWSKLSPPGYRHLIPISSTPGCKPRCHDGSDASFSWMTNLMSDLFHLLPKPHAQGNSCMKTRRLLRPLRYFKLFHGYTTG